MITDLPRELPRDLLAGRSVFVSGGGGGVNLGIALACARAGADIGLCGRTESTLEEASKLLAAEGAAVSYAVADVRDLEAVQAALDHVGAELGPVHGAVCGAAGNFVAPAERISTNGFRAVMDIDVLGSFHVAKAAFEQLRQTCGSLLFVSGGQSDMPFVHQSHVNAAKAGVDQLMRALAVEWGPLGIRSNSVLPGPVSGTEGMRRLVEATGVEVWEKTVPLGRFAELDEVGRMSAILMSSWASYVNGAVLNVDGGMSLSGPVLFNEAILALSDPPA